MFQPDDAKLSGMKPIALALLLALAGCNSPDTVCPDTAPLDCGNGTCCPTQTPYWCPNGGNPKCFPYGPADGPACAGYVLCGGSSGSSGTSGSGPCAHWTCNGQSQCESVMGGPSGVQCQFAAGQSCAQWCQQNIPGACTCS
ncbi:MAG: hypothetical protein JST54_06925 [Deltaproteobacteria bacterium]|nr:hypothetical protein [Deltaproteobacteria bacterium]